MEEMRFKLANYDGGLPTHSTPEPKGSLVLTPNGTWALEFAGGFRKSAAWIRANFEQHPFEVTETGPASCHVAIRDSEDPAISAGFDLPLTPAAGLRNALAGYVTAAITAQERASAIQRGPQIHDAAAHRSAPSPIGPTLSVADELAKLAQLRDAGVLTEEEFSVQKARLLA
jgi:hypothetical protein